jgi:hypothetical protein
MVTTLGIIRVMVGMRVKTLGISRVMVGVMVKALGITRLMVGMMVRVKPHKPDTCKNSVWGTFKVVCVLIPIVREIQDTCKIPCKVHAKSMPDTMLRSHFGSSFFPHCGGCEPLSRSAVRSDRRY